jgi:F-type H+-transporting ATPase subunit delta
MSEDSPARDAQLAAEMDADTGLEHVAGVYAEAFLGAARAAGKTDELLGEFDSLVRDVLDGYPKLEEILVSALISHDDKIDIIDRVFGTQASPLVLNFLKVLSGHGRLDCLRAVQRRAHQLLDEFQGRVRVRVTTAAPVDPELAGRIAQGLSGLLDGEPVLEQAVDPELIGGVVVQVGDTVYDGSIAWQLENVRQQMIDRSAHEIQSRRDRFRNPAGN